MINLIKKTYFNTFNKKNFADINKIIQILNKKNSNKYIKILDKHLININKNIKTLKIKYIILKKKYITFFKN